MLFQIPREISFFNILKIMKNQNIKNYKPLFNLLIIAIFIVGVWVVVEKFSSSQAMDSDTTAVGLEEDTLSFKEDSLPEDDISLSVEGSGEESGSSDIDLENLSDEDLAAVQAFLRFREIKNEFIPTGVPDVYGEELNISFDQVQDAINKVRVFGPTYGVEGKKIALTGPDLKRYKKIGASIACEYCCGVKTLTKEDGTAACGCAHSIMMRGLAAYLIKNHPEVSDEWILEELTKWRITFFPKQTLSVKLKELEEAGETGIEELLQEFPDFLPQMVGGC